jgi:tetratricopeptide (TPR) repeat protein
MFKALANFRGRRGVALGDLIASGDAANAARRWAEASEAYRKALELDPSLASIWVQFGHALKEQGDIQGAIAAYARAASMAPAEFDPPFQLGHVLKSVGDTAGATAAFRRASALDPTHAEVKREIDGLSAPGAAPAEEIPGDAPAGRHALQGRLERVTDDAVVGWAWDRARPGATVTVELLLDGVPVATTLASRFRRDLLAAGIGTGAHGFAFPLAELPPGPTAGRAAAVHVAAAEGHWLLGSLTMPGPRAAAAATSANAAAPAKRVSVGRRPLSEAEIRQAVAAAREAERQRDHARAASVLDAALDAAPKEFDLLFLRARIAMAEDDFAAAERWARAALLRRRDHPRPTVILARVAMATGRLDEAVDLWARVPPGDEAYRERLIKRGRALQALGRAAEALTEFALAKRLNDQDRDAWRGLAETTESLGALQLALARWRVVTGLVPQDAAAQERVRDLTQRLAVPKAALGSPLRGASLLHWRGSMTGRVDGGSVEPAPGVILRAGRGGVLHYAATIAERHRPGDLPSYGLWLAAEGAGAAIAFALRPDAAAQLAQGLEMAMAIEGLDGSPVPWLLTLGGTQLAAGRLQPRAVLTRFPLRLDEAGLAALSAGGLALTVSVAEPARLRLHPPRPLRLVAVARPDGDAAEDRVAAAGLSALRAVMA